MKYIKLYLASVALLATFTASAKVIEYKEDPYCMQAPKEIVDIVEKAASLFGYAGDYEVVAPKTSAVEVNPANAFIGHSVNTSTKNNFIVINTNWFSTLPEEQKAFFLGRCFIGLNHGGTPWYINYMFYIYGLFSLLILIFMVLLLGRFLLSRQKLWVRIVVALLALFALEVSVLDMIYTKTLSYALLKHNMKVDKEVYDITGNKEAAIAALEGLHNSVQKELEKGQNFWLPYKSTYQERADLLKQI